MKPQKVSRIPSRVPYICNNCLARNRRAFSTSKAKAKAPSSKAYAPLSSRGLLALSGPDSSKYLLGAITSTIYPSTPPFFSAFLNAQGRVLHDVFIYPFHCTTGKYAGQEAWLLECDVTQLIPLQKHIKKFKLRSKFEVRIIDPQEMGVWQVWDDDVDFSDELPRSQFLFNGLAQPISGVFKSVATVIDTRAPRMGLRIVTSGAAAPTLGEGICEVDEKEYTLRRYLRGVPEGQKELIPEVALPQGSNLDYMGALDYRKGCYLGQELTIRTHHQGVVRRRILPLIAYGMDDYPPRFKIKTHNHGAITFDSDDDYGIDLGVDMIPSMQAIKQTGKEDTKRGGDAGKWLAGIGNIGLGLCRLDAMTPERVPGYGELSGRKKGDEFVIRWGEDDEGVGRREVKVRPFVPAWHAKNPFLENLERQRKAGVQPQREEDAES